MKKILTIVAALFIMAGSASAQKGSFYLGFAGINPISKIYPNMGGIMDYTMGNILGTGVMYSKDGDDSVITFGIAPEFGYFIADRFAVGLGAGFNYMSEKEEGHDSEGTITWGVNPYARFYPVKGERFGLYLQLGFNYFSRKKEAWSEAQDIFSVGITPGISYNVSERIAIHATFGFLGYAHTDTNDTFGLNLDGKTLMFGLTFGL